MLRVWTGPCCFTSEMAYWGLVRGAGGGGGGGEGRKSEASTEDTARKRPERPWTAARTMEVLRRCSLAIAQRLVHCAIAVSTAVLGRESQRQCSLHCCWGTTRSERSPTFAAQLHLPTHDLFRANLRVQPHLPPLDLLIFWSRLEPWPGRSCGTEIILFASVSFLCSYRYPRSTLAVLPHWIAHVWKVLVILPKVQVAGQLQRRLIHTYTYAVCGFE